jgi:hypothetical protein
MMKFRAALALWILLLSHWALADQGYDEEQNQQYEEEQQEEQEQEQDQEQQEEQQYNQYGQNDGGNQDGQQDANYDAADYNYQDDYKAEIEICSDGVIQVQDIQVYCDSPGTFYYGSGKYRNSPSCLPGDKGQIRIDFYIAQPDVIMNNGNYALVDVSAYGGWGVGSKTVYESADLCSLSTLSSKKNQKNQCPYSGYYYIKTHFYWEESDGTNSDQSFYPTVTVGFKSNLNSNAYDYGGANTDLCSGSSFITWTNGVATSYANALGNFVRSFGILLVTIGCLGAFIWVLVKRPKSFKDARQKISGKRNPLLDDEFDFSKMRKSGQTNDLVDF